MASFCVICDDTFYSIAQKFLAEYVEMKCLENAVPRRDS
jgi:hypothetical protein